MTQPCRSCCAACCKGNFQALAAKAVALSSVEEEAATGAKRGRRRERRRVSVNKKQFCHSYISFTITTYLLKPWLRFPICIFKVSLSLCTDPPGCHVSPPVLITILFTLVLGGQKVQILIISPKNSIEGFKTNFVWIFHAGGFSIWVFVYQTPFYHCIIWCTSKIWTYYLVPGPGWILRIMVLLYKVLLAPWKSSYLLNYFSSHYLKHGQISIQHCSLTHVFCLLINHDTYTSQSVKAHSAEYKVER